MKWTSCLRRWFFRPLLLCFLSTAVFAEGFDWNSDTYTLFAADLKHDGDNDLLLQANITAQKHYFIRGLADANGCSDSLSGNTDTTGAMTIACTVSATLAQQTYFVTTIGNSKGLISASKFVDHGQTTTFWVKPNPGYTAMVTGCGGSLSDTIYTTGAITSACTVSATFIHQSSLQTTYLHTDVLGSVILETDVNGNVKKRTEYQPFGESKAN